MTRAAARRLISAGASTVLANGFTFVTALLLLRNFQPVEFGVYAMVTTLLTVGNMVVGALVAQQMGYSLTRTPKGALRASAGRMYGSVAAVCTIVYIPFVVVVLNHTGSSLALLLVGAAYVATSMFRAYTRHHFFASQQPIAALKQDLVYVFFAAAILGATAAEIGLSGKMGIILSSLGAANVVAIALVPPPRPAVILREFKRHIIAFRRHSLRATWSLATVALSTLSLLSPNLILLARASLGGLAIVSAPGVLLAPLRLVTVVFQSTLRSEFSHLVHQKRRRELQRLYLITTGAGLALSVALLATTYVAWPLIYSILFARGYAPDTVWNATLLSILATSVTTTRFPGAMLLNAHNRFAVSATAWLFIVPLVFGLAAFFSSKDEFAHMLYAPLMGEVAVAVVEAHLVIRLIFGNSRFGPIAHRST